MKLLKIIDNELEIVRGREDVLNRLKKLYKPHKVNRLYNLYCSIQLNGIDELKNVMSESSYYRNIKELEESRIDFSQSYKIEEKKIYYFNPFEYEEVV